MDCCDDDIMTIRMLWTWTAIVFGCCDNSCIVGFGCFEICVCCSSANFLLLSFTLLFILKQNSRIRGPGEHYALLYSKFAIVQCTYQKMHEIFTVHI